MDYLLLFSSKFLNKLCIKNAWKSWKQKVKKSLKNENYFQNMIASWKYLSGMGFHFIITVFENFEFRHRFSFFEKKVWISAFEAKFAISWDFVEKWAQIIKYGQTIIEIV